MPPCPVICVFCNKPIARRSDLIVFGRSYRASHAACFESNRAFFDLPVNGPGAWRMAVWLNGMVLAAYFLARNFGGEFITVILTLNAAILITRLIVYLAYERRLN
jgi:hypothetical protein